MRRKVVYNYIAVLKSDKKNKKVYARVPDLHGCISSGRTIKEAISNIIDAATEWIHCAETEDLPIPEPTVLTYDDCDIYFPICINSIYPFRVGTFTGGNTMQKVIITIEDGMLTGVYTDGEPIDVELVDYDNIYEGGDDTGAKELEAAIKARTIKSCYPVIESEVKPEGDQSDWFGIVRWCDEDIVVKLKDMGIEPTEDIVQAVSRECENNSYLREVMIETGWMVIEEIIEDIRERYETDAVEN